MSKRVHGNKKTITRSKHSGATGKQQLEVRKSACARVSNYHINDPAYKIKQLQQLLLSYEV